MPIPRLRNLAPSILTGLALGLVMNPSPASASDDHAGKACTMAGTWIDAKSGKALTRNALFTELSGRQTVLLGEMHTSAEHHRWQLHTLSALYSRTDRMVIGFEAFPRRVQPVLDQWVDGKLDRKAFLKAADWRTVWGFNADLYMPLFDFARMNRIPMVALNVERKLVSRVGKEGWDKIPKTEREGVGDPSPASADYRKMLAGVYLKKQQLKAMTRAHGGGGEKKKAETTEAKAPKTIEDVLKLPEFKHFVEAQLTWDRAMAEALAKAKTDHPGALIVGVMGSGHLASFHGVPHQLSDLGIADKRVLVPVSPTRACDFIGTGHTDVIYTVKTHQPTGEARKRLRLGVYLGNVKGKVSVMKVVEGSVAEATKILKDDRFVRAAGVAIRKSGDLVEVISRQAPGTWLPLTIERGGKELDMIAKFPPAQKNGS